MMKIRHGKTVHIIDKYEGQRCIVESKTYESLNQAKKANGLFSTCLRAGQKLPPTRAELQASMTASTAT